VSSTDVVRNACPAAAIADIENLNRTLAVDPVR
jgi:hypothetical protein